VELEEEEEILEEEEEILEEEAGGYTAKKD